MPEDFKSAAHSAEELIKFAALPHNPVRGELFHRDRCAVDNLAGGHQPTTTKRFYSLRLWSGARPCSPLGAEPVGRLGVLVPLGPDAYIASCAVEIRHAPIGGCLVHPQTGQ